MCSAGANAIGLVDGHGRPLALVITGEQGNDGARLTEVLADIRVPRVGQGRPRTRPDIVMLTAPTPTGSTGAC